MIIPFGEWAPDSPDLGNSGATTAKNVIPHKNGYKPIASLSAYSSALTAYCRGAFSGVDADGNVSTYAGDATKLYRLVGATMTDSSGATYTTASDSYWEFTQWNNRVIATNFDDAMQAINLGSTTFGALAGSPPRARHIAVIGDFVVVGNTYDTSDGNVPNRVRWCGIDDEESWTVSATTQADYQDLKGNGGWVQAIVGGEYGLVFQERAIWRMTYVGSPIVFQFDRIDEARGAFAPRSVVQVGSMTFFLADDGFYMTQGGASVPIGDGKVDKTFLAELDDSYLHRVTAAALPNDKVVMWSYPSSGSVDGTPDKVIMYNWAANKWSFAEFDHELVYRAMSVGVTLDSMDSSYPQLDSISFPLDSKVWMGGKLQLAAFDTAHKLAYFTGTSLDAVIETGEFQASPNQRAEILGVIPLVDGGTHTVQMGTRETQAGTVSWGSVSTENNSGICPVRSNSRYHRIRVNNTGNFTDAIGANIPDDMVSVVGGR